MGGAATYVFPVSAKNPLPEGIEDMKDLDRFAAAHGARVLRRSATIPFGDNETYAYLQQVVQRNLYRIPLR